MIQALQTRKMTISLSLTHTHTHRDKYNYVNGFVNCFTQEFSIFYLYELLQNSGIRGMAQMYTRETPKIQKTQELKEV